MDVRNASLGIDTMRDDRNKGWIKRKKERESERERERKREIERVGRGEIIGGIKISMRK